MTGEIITFDDPDIGRVMKEAGYDEKAITIARKVDERIPALPGKTILRTNNPIYIAIMPDDSGSIAGENEKHIDNTQDVIDGHNDIINALKESEQKDRILFKTRYLNGKVLNDWTRLKEAKDMDKNNFYPSGSTPLYDSTIHLLNSVIREREGAVDRGVEARWGIMIVTDADDTSSVSRAEDVRVILDNMKEKREILRTTEPDNRIAGSIAFMGVSDGTTDFKEVANKMGIEWVITADRTSPKEMRRAFNTFSPQVIYSARR